MKKIIITLVGLLTINMMLASSTKAEDDWFTLYGKVHVAYDKLDYTGSDEDWEFNSYASRLGFKGKGAVSDNLEAFYHLEWQVDVVFESDDKIKDRNQVIGLRGNFGEVLAGRHDTPTKSVQNKIDLFSDMPGDLKYSFNGEVRAAEMVQYSTPMMGNHLAKVAVVVDDDKTDDNGVSASVAYKTGALIVGVSYDSDIEKENLETIRLTSQYKISDWQLGFMFQQTDYNSDRGDGYLLSAKYSFGDYNLNMQYLDSNIWNMGISSKIKYSSQYSLGIGRKVVKNFNVYGYMSEGTRGATSIDDTVVGVGFVYKFKF